MGAFYGSIQVRSEDRDAVKAAVEAVAQESKRKFLLGPLLNGWIAVYPDHSGQDEACVVALAKRLNNILLQLIVHDDDVFVYNFFRNGELLNEYSSRPDYFEEVSTADRERLRPKTEIFRDLANSPETLAEISRLLDATENEVEFTVEQDRMEELANILGIQNTLTSYEYLKAGEREGVEDWKQFVHIPDQTAEKAAKKEAEAALYRKKLELQKSGLLCNEWLPPCTKRDAEHSWADFCTDPIDGGFMVLWRRMGFKNPPQLLHLQPPWPHKPQPFEHVFPSTNPESMMISPKGNWLAFSDSGLQLWDWRQRKLIADIQFEACPVAFSEDEKLLLCQREQTLTLVSLETRQVVHTIEAETRTGEAMAFHPSNTFIVTRPRENEFGIIWLQSGKMFTVPFSEANNGAPDFRTAINELNRTGLRNKWKEEGIGRGISKIMNLRFSPDGLLIFCATTIGLRVYVWTELLASIEDTPKPLFSVTPIPEAVQLDLIHYDNYVYDVVLDEVQNRLLFCGIEGTIRFLDLNDGSTGILIDPPGKSPIWQLKLSYDRKFICCFCTPAVEDRDHKPPRLQVWDYTALCKEAGL